MGYSDWLLDDFLFDFKSCQMLSLLLWEDFLFIGTIMIVQYKGKQTHEWKQIRLCRQMGIRNYITFQRLVGTHKNGFFFSLIKGGCSSNKQSSWASWSYSWDADMMDSFVYHTTEKEAEVHPTSYIHCWSWFVCDSQASHVLLQWIHSIITRPLLQPLELFLTLIFGLTSSNLLHNKVSLLTV